MTGLLLLQIVGGVVAFIVAIGGVVAMLWAITKVKGVELSLGMLNSANEGLRKVVGDLQADKSRANETFLAQLKAQELDCAKAIAKLEGQVSTLTSQVDLLTTGLADRIIAAVKAGDAASDLGSRIARVEAKVDLNQGDGK